MRKMPVARDFSRWFLVLRVSNRGCLLVLLVWLAFSCPTSARDAVAAKNILIFESFSVPSLGTAEAVKSALRTRSPWPINFYVEYLEGQRFDDEGYLKDVFETLQHTYSGQKLDLIMAESYPAFQFVLSHRNELFPGVPIIFWGVNPARLAGRKISPGVTGVTDNIDPGATIDLALHLHPETTTVAVITNNSEFERFWLAVIQAQLLRYQGKVREVDLVALPTSRLLESVAALPRQTVVLFQEGPQASVQPAMGPYDILAWVGQRLPTYCIWPVACLNHGGIGGVDSNWEKTQIPVAAEVARRVLSGERPDDIPVVNGTGYKVRVDWRQLRHWNIQEAALPAGSVVLHREPTLWERYRNYIIAAIALIVVQFLLIFALLWQRARKRKAEAVLRESEKRFRVMADTTPSLIWMCDEQGKVIYLNERRVAFAGPDPGAGYGDTWTAYVHPDDLRPVLAALSWALKSRKTFSKEYRLRRRDGVYRWMFDVASPRVNGDGSFAGFIGSAIDVTDQKLAQEALEKVGGRLLEAQEEERRHIARELHDDISQKLALLAMELAQANRSVNGSPEATKQRLEEIRRHCSDVAHDVQSLSHQLHNSKLDYLGIVAALRGFCKEFSRQYDVSIEFKDKNVPTRLPKNVSLCLFRVAQEALHNAVKYSGTKEVAVEVSVAGDELQLVVNDEGAGFNVEEAKKESGLGLLSMQERVHLVHGVLRIESRPGEGTRIVVSLPLMAERSVPPAEARSAQTAGVPGAA
jgi:PAS domain S-box-containing protein